MQPEAKHRGGAEKGFASATSNLIKMLTPQPKGERRSAPQPFAWVPAYLPALSNPRRLDQPMPEVLGRMGDFEVRLARSGPDVRRAQALRYEVFYEEMSAQPSPAAAMLRRDADVYDAICDHVLVVDHGKMVQRPFRAPEPKVIATYRLLRQEVADLNDGFYSESEFDVAPLITRQAGKRILELGRSCVLKEYRSKRTVELLWHGVWTYVRHHRIDVMFGCASLEGTDPKRLALPLSFLHYHCRAPEDWRVRAVDSRYVEMARLSPEAVDPKAALHALPPLLKGYLRLGAWVGDGAVVDHQFGTTDVFLILPTARISSRYIGYFGADADRHKVPVAA